MISGGRKNAAAKTHSSTVVLWVMQDRTVFFLLQKYPASPHFGGLDQPVRCCRVALTRTCLQTQNTIKSESIQQDELTQRFHSTRRVFSQAREEEHCSKLFSTGIKQLMLCYVTLGHICVMCQSCDNLLLLKSAENKMY